MCHSCGEKLKGHALKRFILRTGDDDIDVVVICLVHVRRQHQVT